MRKNNCLQRFIIALSLDDRMKSNVNIENEIDMLNCNDFMRCWAYQKLFNFDTHFKLFKERSRLYSPDSLSRKRFDFHRIFLSSFAIKNLNYFFQYLMRPDIILVGFIRAMKFVMVVQAFAVN